jgi:NhaA family Na+:H+ antiporter
VPGSLVGNIRCRAEGHSMTGRRTHVRIPVVGRLITPLGEEFTSVEALGGIGLLFATVAALVWANSPWSDAYESLWEYELTIGIADFAISNTLREWVNDGLMAAFFFVVGVEIKREFVEGELSEPDKARLPVAAAIGGMAIPALIYVAWNPGGSAVRGWGIPMATDLAFALGVLALLGSRVQRGLKVFLLTLAIVDDIAAIVVIAVFYSEGVDVAWLGGAGLVVAAIYLARLFGLRHPIVAVAPALVLWVCFFESGVHATLAGVTLGLLIPARTERDRRALDRIEHDLHPWTSLLVVPLFALANAGIALGPEALREAASSPITWGVVTGLVVGKIVGIVGVTLIGARLRLGRLPSGVRGRQILGMGAVAGIGFTVSLFVSELAFDGTQLEQAKLGILAASVIAALLGISFLLRSTRPTMRRGGR